MEWIQIASTFGFPALFSVILFVTYKELVRQVIEVVKTNTEALRDNCNANSQLIQRLDALERLIQRERTHA
jgi:uncharacterized protein YigA (DUF484 family)